jgi:hypothetical protein
MEPTIRGNDKGSHARHMRAVRLMRYRDVCRAMPPHKDEKQQVRRKRYAWFVVQQSNRQQLARTVWPWQAKPLDPGKHPEARVKRGRSSNPTAL